MFGIAILPMGEIWFRRVSPPPGPSPHNFNAEPRLRWVPAWWWYNDPKLSRYENLK